MITELSHLIPKVKKLSFRMVLFMVVSLALNLFFREYSRTPEA